MTCYLVILSLLGPPAAATERQYPTCEAARQARDDLVVIWRSGTESNPPPPVVAVAIVEERPE